MAIKRPDIYEHNNPNNAFVDSDSVRGGTRTPVADLSELYNLSAKIDQLKERSTRVYVISESAYYELIDISNVGKPSGWGKELQIESEIFLVVSTRPITGVENKIYIVPSEDPEEDNQFDEWIWVNEKWERIGGLSIDLSNYYTKTQVNNLLNNKVDKVPGKQLTDENYTTEERNKLASITAIFTTALKNAYDNVVNWISENGEKVLNHINSPHAPADAQKNSDITKGEIEAKLTGTINSHKHNYDDLTGKPDIPPPFNPYEHDLDEFRNASTNPYARMDDLPPAFDPTELLLEIDNLNQNKVDKTDSRLSDSREWTASTVSESEAEEGTSTTRRAWTALRVRQAITAWWNSIGTTFGKGFISLTNATQAREKLELGDSATKDVGQSRDTVMEGDDDRIVDGGVVRESILLTSKDNIDDIITPGHYHTFKGDVANGFNMDTGGSMKVLLGGENNEVFQIVYEANNTLLTRSFLGGSWTEWNRYAPMHWVNNNFAKLSDIYKENAVLDGDWFLKPNTEDTYNVIAREYIINKVLYTDTITGEVTRAPRHATLRRWDMITVESDHTFLITSGVPALDPTRPIPNKQQAVLTYIFVSAIADAPVEPDFLLLYDENVGEPAESNVTTGAPSIVDLDSTEAPFQGTTHILFNERVADTEEEAVVFRFTTLQNLNNYGKLIMHMATSRGGASNNHFLIHVKNGNTTIASFSSVAISWSPTGVGNWERGVLDMSEYANLQNDEFDKIIIDASNGPGWDGYIQEGSKLDYIFLTEKDDTTPVNPVVIQKTSDIPINDGATGVSPYAEIDDVQDAIDEVVSKSILQGEDSEETIKYLSVKEEIGEEPETIYFVPKSHNTIYNGQLTVFKYPSNTEAYPEENDLVEGFMNEVIVDPITEEETYTLWFVRGRYLGDGSFFNIKNYELLNGSEEWE